MFRCRRCSRRLGRYPLHDTRDLENEKWKNPRTGTGLYREHWHDRNYVRVRCKCGRNEKVSDGKLRGEFATTKYGDEVYL